MEASETAWTGVVSGACQGVGPEHWGMQPEWHFYKSSDERTDKLLLPADWVLQFWLGRVWIGRSLKGGSSPQRPGVWLSRVRLERARPLRGWWKDVRPLLENRVCHGWGAKVGNGSGERCFLSFRKVLRHVMTTAQCGVDNYNLQGECKTLTEKRRTESGCGGRDRSPLLSVKGSKRGRVGIKCITNACPFLQCADGF